jgi:hypothetical protein
MANNPEQTFVVWSLSREEISVMLNEAIDRTNSKVKPFTQDDERLTDEVCEGIVSALWDVTVCDIDEVVDKEAEYFDAYIEEM